MLLPKVQVKYSTFSQSLTMNTINSNFDFANNNFISNCESIVKQSKYYFCVYYFLIIVSGQHFFNFPRFSRNSASIFSKNCICGMIYLPVCGADGITYSNHCHAVCKNKVKLSSSILVQFRPETLNFSSFGEFLEAPSTFF